MNRVPRHFLLLAAAAVCAWSCAAPAPTPTSAPTGAIAAPPAAPSASPPPATPSAEPVVLETFSGGSFERPAGWASWTPNRHAPWLAGPVLYLSTDPLLPACATSPGASPNPPDAGGMACPWPLVSLSPGGVLVDWYAARILRPQPSAGEAVQVNGEAARLQVERPGRCAAIGGDETMSVLVPIGLNGRWSNVAVDACLRGPGLAASEAQVRAMLASVTGVR